MLLISASVISGELDFATIFDNAPLRINAGLVTLTALGFIWATNGRYCCTALFYDWQLYPQTSSHQRHLLVSKIIAIEKGVSPGQMTLALTN